MSAYYQELERRQFLMLWDKLYKERMKDEKSYNLFAEFQRKHDGGPFAGAFGAWWKKYLPASERDLRTASPKLIARLKAFRG